MQDARAVLGMSQAEADALKLAGSRRRGALIDDVAADLNISRDAAARRLRSLASEGFLKRSPFRYSGQVKYLLTDCGRQALGHVRRTERQL
jgi:predicted transcriptional regulator